MKQTCLFSVVLLALALQLPAATPLASSTRIGGFPLGVQAYTFREFTAFEAIEKTAISGGKIIELYLWQRLSPTLTNVVLNENLSDAHIALLKAKLDRCGVRAVCAYFNNSAFGGDNPEPALRKVFDFARKMDLVALVGEPPEKHLNLVERLTQDYNIRFCLHNHRRETGNPEYRYWDPEYTAKLLAGRDERMGVSLDVGHIARSGLRPVDALKALQGRVLSVHIKDPVSAPDGHDTILGQGIADVPAIYRELRRQKFDGFVVLEYEHNPKNPLVDVTRCINYIRALKDKRG